MTLALTTELEAVNRMLLAVNESPVNSLDAATSVDVSIARALLRAESRQVQAIGWQFNTDYDVELLPDVTTGKIAVPTNALEIDLTEEDKYTRDIVRRGAFLYDRVSKSDVFTAAVKCSVTWFFAFEDLPETARYYIMLRAARVFQEKRLGSDSLSARDREDEARAWGDLKDAEGVAADYTVFDHPSVSFALDRRPWPR